MTRIELNGEPFEVPCGQSLQELASQIGVAGQAVAVAVNREIVPRERWPARRLLASDKVDIVRAIGGG
ncbi:sulfur carrier protein ThiS [Massilia sp. H6]|uniref:sulfur carrier protein ThiS n=1 Tax=Massilia sp. H6 TaxID=2970464 RepID=UPI0021687B2B|nr:sulfur carrier protein ThiS [Massilia sp. H6]UVW29438.1 sulfur carrier protein ThiS [Massilia sp. H6]